MQSNRTSEAVEAILFMLPEAKELLSKDSAATRAICEKYKRMEQGLEQAQQFIKEVYDCENQETHEALTFDPLADAQP